MIAPDVKVEKDEHVASSMCRNREGMLTPNDHCLRPAGAPDPAKHIDNRAVPGAMTMNTHTNNTKEILCAAAQVLSLTPESHPRPNSHCSEQYRTVTRCVRECVCPGLSLKHGKESISDPAFTSSEHRHCHHDRKQAEERAVKLLARPLQRPRSAVSTSIGYEVLGEEEDPAAQLLQKNLCSSFAVLMDSRLHAYSTVLARHAMSLPDEVPNVQEKLAEILLVGTRVEAETVSTQFLMRDDENDESSLTFHVTMDLTIPSDRNSDNKSKKTIAVAFETAGSIHGTCDVWTF